MKIDIKPGKYVVAVSGGVDSMVLLDLLVKLAMRQKTQNLSKKTHDSRLMTHDSTSWKLVVAHFDHGIREDSAKDRLLVEQEAQRRSLPFVYDEGKLGPDASEATARKARYAFLNRVREAAGAQAIITAHHQDDLIETAIINILRGTGRKGLTALQGRPGTLRPLLHIPKSELIAYAQRHKLVWREDPTNQDTKYLRNYIRTKLLPRFSIKEKKQFLTHIGNLAVLNRDIEQALTQSLHIQPAPGILDRQWFIMLPHKVSMEFLATWLREHEIRGFDKKLLEKIVAGAKTLRPGKQIDVDRTYVIKVGKDELALTVRTGGRLPKKK